MRKRSTNRLLIVLFLAVTSFSGLWAQPLSEWITAADNAYQKADYYSAFRYYDVALKYDPTRMDLWYKMGESAQQFTAYNAAQSAYDRVAASTFRDSFPLLPFRRAEVLQRKGAFQAAATLYDQFISTTTSTDAEVLKTAERNLINSEWAADVVNRPKATTVRNLGDQVNSPHSDFGPFFQNATLYFSSLRYTIKRDSVLPRRPYSKILRRTAPDQDAQALAATSIFNQTGRLTAHPSYNAAGTTVYFTLCDYQRGTTDFHCDIYYAPVLAGGQWGIPKRLPLNDTKATSTHPNVGKNPADGTEYLYFVSDRQGGAGGLDIYRAKILADGACGPVQALTEINTEGDDVTPFYYAPTQTLYFSTDGRLTMGGFDIYRSSWNGRNWDRPSNMEIPVNSSYNDTYYSRFPQQELAFFASNRPDSLALFWDDTKDACCNDLYSVGITDEIKLLALTFNALDLTELAGSSVALYELTPGGRRLVDSLNNPRVNDFNFVVIPGKQYELVATKPGFTTDRDTLALTDPKLANQMEIERRLYLSPDLKLDVFTFNKLDSTALAGTTVFLHELTPEGELVLVDSIINPTANDYHFKLKRGKQYQVFARKDGYVPDMTYIDTNDPKFASVNEIRNDLYLEPGLALEVYTWRLLDSKPLVGSTVFLYEYSDEDGETLVDSLTNVHGYQFGFPVEKGKGYVIRGAHDGYGPDITSLDLTGADIPDNGTFRRDLYLGQLLEVFVFDAVSEAKLPGAEVRLLDATTGELIAEKINPDNNDFYFSVTLDKPYRIEVLRKGYKPVSEVVTFSDEDLKVGGGKISLDIFMEPYTDPCSMLPLYLYYDNDHPNPKSTSPTTDLEYVSTNVEYFKKKQTFIQSFTRDMELEEAFRTRRRFDDFFNLEVRSGRYDLEEFAKPLLVYLQSGNTFVVDLKGFASSRASTIYNQILSQRRIAAVYNFFDRYQNEASKSYIALGALRFTELPVGETQADPRVVDKVDDPKNSIYNVFASLERRVEVRCATSNNQ